MYVERMILLEGEGNGNVLRCNYILTLARYHAAYKAESNDTMTTEDKERIKRLEDSMQQVNLALSSMMANQILMSERMEATFQRIDTRFEAIDARFEAINAKLNALPAEIRKIGFTPSTQ